MKIKYPFEIGCFLVLLLVFNLVKPSDPFSFHLHPSALFSGELSRWFTFAWKHISFYHLAMDASAFLFLYQALRCHFARRLQHLGCCIFFSGLVPLLLDPRLWDLGLCGLSGVAHGLMLICALESAEQPQKSTRLLSVVIFLGILGKTIFEQVTGTVLFANQHLGNVGTPIASCHYGGLIGAIVSYPLCSADLSFNSRRNPAKIPPCPFTNQSSSLPLR